jgi:6-pyruvoyltetrahydropterin/6-carboxytetrahydropterin synthase
MKYFEITRKLEFDAGHRIPNHNGQCRHLHGHRYCLEVTLRGQVNETSGARDEGMIMDFGDIKKIMNDPSARNMAICAGYVSGISP